MVAKTSSEVAAINEKTFVLLVDEMPYFALSTMRNLVVSAAAHERTVAGTSTASTLRSPAVARFRRRLRSTTSQTVQPNSPLRRRSPQQRAKQGNSGKIFLWSDAAC